MSDCEPNDSELLRELKVGKEDAANKLFNKYFERVVAAAERRIGGRRLREADADDIAVSVFKSLWAKAENDFFDDEDLKDSNEFWRLLCTMIRFKTEDRFKHENAQKRGGGNLRGESFFADPNQTNPGIEGVAGKSLTADEKTAFKEQHERMMQVLNDVELQEIATMRLEELKIGDIAKKFDRSQKWVKRKLAMIRQIWQREIDSE